MSYRLTWFGHSTLSLITEGTYILIDPFFTGNPSATMTADTVNADYILVTHGHGDHIGDTVAIAKRTGALVITNFEIANWLETQGVKTHPQHIGGGFRHPFGYLKLTPALHGSGLPDGSYGGSPAGFLLTLNSKANIYFAGDTGLFSEMRLLGEENIDLAVLPIGDNFTMGPEDGLRAVKMLQPKHVIPIHFGTFDIIKQDAKAWCRRVELETNTRSHLLEVNGTYYPEY